jgi:predicted Zn-dependent peptidase
MLFQGSADVEANEHFELVQRAGGTQNGSTWLERTNYFETVPSNQLELALWLEANRMGKLLPAMTQQKLDTQREVVMNERRWSMDNQPYGTWMEKLPALCFPVEHPFNHSLMGSMDDLTAASLDDVAQFFATYYTPDNAVLSIAGDFDPTDARRLIEKHFGDIPRGAGKPPLPDMSLPPVFGQWKRRLYRTTSCCPELFLAFRSPAFGTEQYYAASVCGAILRLRNGSRLRRRLVRERPDCRRRFGLHVRSREGERPAAVVDATARPGRGRRAAGARWRTRSDTIVRDGIEAAEVERAVAVIQTSFVSALQEARRRADRLSLFAHVFSSARVGQRGSEPLSGSHRRARQRFHSRTARREQSRESALCGARSECRRRGSNRRGGGGPMTAPTTGKAARPTPGAPREYHFPRFERRRLDNGIELIVAPVTKLPLVTVAILSDAGSVCDPAGREGIAQLVAS